MRTIRILLLSVLILLHYLPNAAASDSIDPSLLPFDPLPKATLRAAPVKTFIRWHVAPISVDNAPPANDFYTRNFLSPDGYGGQYKAYGGFARQRPLPRDPISSSDWKIVDMQTDVERAIALGADGFAFSIYQIAPKDGWNKLLNMLEGAKRADPDFRVMLYLDCASLESAHPSPQALADAIASVASHPSVFRTDDGRLVITAGAPHILGYAYMADVIAHLADDGISVFFMAYEHNWDDLHQFAAIADGYGRYGATNPVDAPKYASSVAKAHGENKLYMGSVMPQLFRPRRGWYTEAQNSEMLRATWQVAIDSKPDWLMLRNWNDFAEGNELSPATGTQWAFYDLSAYYNTWYKTGVQPEIKRDVLYYVHRIQATTTLPDPTKQPKVMVAHDANPAGTRDNIELLAFLTRAGTLRIRTDDKIWPLRAPAGITSFKVPLDNGIPVFSLGRGNKVLIRLVSAFEVRDKIEYQDLLYRAGSSTRPPVDMVANPPLLP